MYRAYFSLKQNQSRQNGLFYPVAFETEPSTLLAGKRGRSIRPRKGQNGG